MTEKAKRAAEWILNQGRKRMAIAQKNSFIDVATAQFLETYRQNAEACAGICMRDPDEEESTIS